MGRKVKLTITESRCRSGFHRKGEEYIIDDTICPPICMELWHYAYPYIWALLNGGNLDDGVTKSKSANILRLFIFSMLKMHLFSFQAFF